MPRFGLIVESDDRAVADILFHVGNYLIGIEAVGVVACHQIPHHESVFLAQEVGVTESEPSVGWAEELTLYQHVCLLHIGKISFRAIGECRDMVHGVIAHMMSCGFDLLEDTSIASHVVAHAEESSVNAIASQNTEHPRGYLGCRTVIECQIDALWLRWYSPK